MCACLCRHEGETEERQDTVMRTTFVSLCVHVFVCVCACVTSWKRGKERERL